MEKTIKILKPVFGEWVNREILKTGFFYQDRPIKGRQNLEIVVEIKFIDDFYYYELDGNFYGQNVVTKNISELREYHKKHIGWTSFEEVC